VNDEAALWEKYGAAVLATETSDGRLLGMTAVERMFLSIGCFLVTSLASIVLLAVLKKITLP
jgi:hypothetical protein